MIDFYDEQTALDKTLEQWAQLSKVLMARDGSSIKGGYTVKNNPLLIAAIEKIRDGYIDLLVEQDKTLIRTPLEDVISRENQLALDDINQTAVAYSRSMLAMLQQEDYGLTQQEKRAADIQDCNNCSGLSSDNALSLLGSIIRCCVASADAAMPPRNHFIARYTKNDLAFRSRPTELSSPTL